MKKPISFIMILFAVVTAYTQTDKEQLALNVSKAEEANQEKLKEYIWKRSSNVFMENQLKLTTITEFKFGVDGKLETTLIDAKTTVKKKPGLRGAAQQNAAEDKAEYVQKALSLALQYAFMSKGEMVDFFDKAALSQKDGMTEAVASNVHVKGDKLLLRIDPNTNLIVFREFTSLLGTDLIDGQLNYDKFSNGTMHGTTTTLNLPAQKMRIDGLNQDYTIRVQ
jgi:hypothetical protein